MAAPNFKSLIAPETLPADFRDGVLELFSEAMNNGMLNADQGAEIARLRSRIEIEIKGW